MRGYLLLLLCALPCIARTGEPAAFAGDYGHTATASADDVVWRVEQAGSHWRVILVAADEAHEAHRLQARGRDAFWSRMDWPLDSSAQAECLTWGDKPGSLQDLLADAPPAPSAPGEDYGHAVLCHVPPAARARIGWIADNASDWFYYDPLLGVIEAHAIH
ncbi:hypothetical protein MUU77_04645 [Pseudoxanthomonas sp. F37]|uniref:hypothetical protein n=1 Tax=Pseudoxanthomonas sp. F37 TaxID=2932492 RepID=UPI001FCFCC85|nr:hypothetical protein [Pseudoxanthomonas sp. F37]UOV09590.1 hypothetical protein MUU77_04645 [Pseudoxanthomonas sp. F37]